MKMITNGRISLLVQRVLSMICPVIHLNKKPHFKAEKSLYITDEDFVETLTPNIEVIYKTITGRCSFIY